MRTPLIPLAALVLALVVPAPPAAADAAETGWFVLRDRMSGDCRIGRLISIDGQYASGNNLIAGGPFASEDEAEARLAILVERGTCNTD